MSDIKRNRKYINISPEKLLEAFNQHEPPFDPYKIAIGLGIEIDEELQYDYIGNSGVITHKNGATTIWLNELDPKNRRRFTLAHELGHYINDVLPNDGGFYKREDTHKTMFADYDEVEVRANKFAAQLLMPKKHIVERGKALLDQYGGSLKTAILVEEMAKIFQVSSQAMHYRLVNLGVIARK